MADTKTCATCGNEKPVSEFEVIRNGHGSRSPRRHCRACMNAKRRKEPDVVETHYGIRYTGNHHNGSHITDYGPDKAQALADFRPSCDSFETELLQRRVTYGAWRSTGTKVTPRTAAAPPQFDLVDTEEL